jgi:hypothetical protein
VWLLGPRPQQGAVSAAPVFFESGKDPLRIYRAVIGSGDVTSCH